MKTTVKIKDIHPGDFLTFKTSDNRYKSIFCIRTIRERSPQIFLFAATTFDRDFKPAVSDLPDIEFWGRGNTKSFKYADQDLQRMWTYHPECKPYYLGTYGILILRKEFMQWRENFELVGNLSIVEHLELNGSGDIYPGTFENLDKFFTGNLQNFMDQKGQEKFKLKAVVRSWKKPDDTLTIAQQL